MQTKINSVNVEHVAKGRTGYDVATVNYGDGKEKKIMSFANPAVFAVVQEFVGQEVEISVTKNGQYFEWSAVTAVGAKPVSASAPATKVTGSNYETAAERAARQVLIVKQSSLSAAIASMTPGAKAPLEVNEVIERAQKFTDYVFDNNVAVPE